MHKKDPSPIVMSADHPLHWAALPLGRSKIGRLDERDGIATAARQILFWQRKDFVVVVERKATDVFAMWFGWVVSGDGNDLAWSLSHGVTIALHIRPTTGRLRVAKSKRNLERAKVPVKLNKNSISLSYSMSSPIPFVRNPFCFYPEVPRISPKGYLPNGLKVPRCRVSQLLSAREAAGKAYLLPADRHDEPEMVRYLQLGLSSDSDIS
ncbi:hypothetical protein C8R47DRAFT_1063361 [Mycena vitilis]|nr:hypothetical protein C8R47DRAFT_1063361 [Mycena vitilis]